MRNENECGDDDGDGGDDDGDGGDDDGDGGGGDGDGGGGDGDGDECMHEFLLPRSVCAITASEKSFDTVWLPKILYEGVAD